jgi:hypothetical protein
MNDTLHFGRYNNKNKKINLQGRKNNEFLNKQHLMISNFINGPAILNGFLCISFSSKNQNRWSMNILLIISCCSKNLFFLSISLRLSAWISSSVRMTFILCLPLYNPTRQLQELALPLAPLSIFLRHVTVIGTRRDR